MKYQIKKNIFVAFEPRSRFNVWPETALQTDHSTHMTQKDRLYDINFKLDSKIRTKKLSNIEIISL